MKKIILAFLITLLFSCCAYSQTIPNATPLYNSYSCNSSTIQFPYAFYINSTSDMIVQQTDNLGNITFPINFSVDTTNVWVNYPLTGSPCPTGYTITLYASTPITQNTAYGNRNPFTATAVGASLNKLTIIGQQLQRQLNSTFTVPVGQTAGTFPSSSPGNYIGWNASGLLANIPSPSNAAIWSLSGANAVYNLGNVSTSGSMTATSGFVGNLTGNASTATTATSLSTTLATSAGGTGATANANAANGVVILNGSSQLPAVSGALLTSIPLVSQTAQPYVKVSETETSGTNGGEATIGSWQTRVINTKDSDASSIASIATNQVTLPAGTYQVHAKSFFENTSVTQLRLQNITAGTTLLTGMNIMPQNGNTAASGMIAPLDGTFILASTSVLALQYQCSARISTGDLGTAGSFGTEVYTVVEFTKTA